MSVASLRIIQEVPLLNLYAMTSSSSVLVDMIVDIICIPKLSLLRIVESCVLARTHLCWSGLCQGQGRPSSRERRMARVDSYRFDNESAGAGRFS